jgi:hypothetical protein
METKQKNFKEKLAEGKEGEHEIANYLISKGYIILPLYQFEDDNKSPKLFYLNDNVTAPDLFVSGNKEALFVEVKTKKRWVTFTRINETGINRRLYYEYRKVHKKTGLPLFIVFNHKEIEPIGYFYVDISTPCNRIWDGIDKIDGRKISEPMVFWRYDQLTKLD